MIKCNFLLVAPDLVLFLAINPPSKDILFQMGSILHDKFIND